IIIFYKRRKVKISAVIHEKNTRKITLSGVPPIPSVKLHVPSKLHTKNQFIHLFHLFRFGYALDLLVTVSSMCYHTSTSALSTSSSSRGLTNLTLWDISS